MANGKHIGNLRSAIDASLRDSGVKELFEEYERLENLRTKFSDLEDDLEEEIRQAIFDAYGEKTTVKKNFTLKNGDVYKYSSNSKAKLYNIMGNLEMFEELGSDLRDKLREAYEERNKDLDDRIDRTTRALMDDDRDFDAATIKVKSSKPKLRLIDIDGSRSCSGETMQPLEDVRDKHVKELVKFIEYQPELLEVVEKMQGRMEAALEPRREQVTGLKEA